MSEEMNSGANPGKTKGMIGMIIGIVSLTLGWWIGAYIMVAINPWVGIIVWAILPVIGIIMSVGASKASKAAGHGNGMAKAGLIIGIISGAINLILVIGAVMLMSAANDLVDELEYNMDDFNDAMNDLEDLQNSQNLHIEL